MTQSLILKNIITSFQKIRMSFGINVSWSHYVTFKLIKKEEEVLLLNLHVHSFHGEVKNSHYSFFMSNIHKNGDLGESAMSTVGQTERGRDLEIVLIFVIMKRRMTASVNLSSTIFRRETTLALMWLNVHLVLHQVCSTRDRVASRSASTEDLIIIFVCCQELPQWSQWSEWTKVGSDKLCGDGNFFLV